MIEEVRCAGALPQWVVRLLETRVNVGQEAVRNCENAFALREAFGYAARKRLEDLFMNSLKVSNMKKSWSTPSIEDFAVADLTQTGGDVIQDGTAKTDETPASS